MTVRTRSMIRHLLGGALAALLAIGGGPAGAQDYPSKTIKIISPSAPGGLTDIVARLIGERLSQNMKVTVVVENRPGGTGAVALDLVAKAPPDGYTLVVGFAGANVIYPLLNDKLPFNAQRDFTPITQVSSGGNFLVVHPSVPVHNVKEFIAYVNAQPKPPTFGSWGNGSGGHLAGEYLKLLTGIRMDHVPYRSNTALATDLAGGHMLLGFLDATNAIQQQRAGKVRVLAQTGPETATLTVADSGPGIPPEDRELVFERFYRAAATRSMPGSGLGLAIVRQVVERLGGTVVAEESDDGGALIRMTLPGSPVHTEPEPMLVPH